MQLQYDTTASKVYYFVNAVHPEHLSKPAHGWFCKGEKVTIKSSAGCKRINIHGAVNLEDFQNPFVESVTVDADSTIALLRKVEAANREKSVIHIFLDNARYHHAKAVKK